MPEAVGDQKALQEGEGEEGMPESTVGSPSWHSLGVFTLHGHGGCAEPTPQSLGNTGFSPEGILGVFYTHHYAALRP